MADASQATLYEQRLMRRRGLPLATNGEAAPATRESRSGPGAYAALAFHGGQRVGCKPKAEADPLVPGERPASVDWPGGVYGSPFEPELTPISSIATTPRAPPDWGLEACYLPRLAAPSSARQ